ncbi:carbohydrate ABC transporter permease [Anoxybacillus ayderensis]|uniref:Inner membrane ABC transporter permease protein ycjP n=2 Tax=Anoxybacillaceae TaxID=3120669 RepID=A0A0D0HNC7_9BACL|nr:MULTISPECIES: carbohydrate ABC transporter permease [Anoxybacillus]AXM89542.1 carbohydrate ABC transporter permease [Anoxybacillus ayderensis G10]KIP21659.1 Inner membrane ABC transporter permease protein ycjP [Anoxybacillus ayderensis]MBW9217678.1 carbohydrate ABC transporter permease [Anoxybacillus sp. ST70]NNU95777.1 carbohydrate ABC transporter permease [Anoxybacillus sp. EFIL]THD16664.1 carbohydrate ABC transporter permease [Anoxybacillus ayderensis]
MEKSTYIYMKKIGMFLFYMMLFLVAGLQILPLVWLLFFSLKNNQEVFNTPLFSLPSPPRWENYVKVWVEGDIGLYFFNSLWITTVSVIFTVLLASFVTFAITRMNWKLKHVVLGLFMVGLMIPIHSTLIPLFNFFMKVKLIDHPMSIVLTNIGFNLPITIMILLGFYNALPRELEESAVMDGCSVHRMFFQVILPMTSPVIVTTTIINMIYNWNEFVFVNTFISSDEYKTLTVGIQNFIGQYTTDWGAIGATLMISVLPILIIFFFLSNKIMEGITAGAIKG